eukprot:m.45542 g.45542  ORF g.45542 m.45542 type:complete len:200 (-) comp6662_c0_seq1:75-674(-)
MIICLGPICIPLWGVLPFLLVVFKKVYEWVMGTPYDSPTDKDKGEPSCWTDAVAEAATRLATDTAGPSEATEGGLRQRNVPGAAAGDEKVVGRVSPVATTSAWVQVLARSDVDGTAVVAKFTAGWCAPCKRIAPVFEELAAAHATATFVEVDVDAAEDVAKGAGAASLPTFQVYRGSRKMATMSGAKEPELRDFVAQWT